MNSKKLPPAWTGDIVGKMHIYGISQQELASRIGKSRQHINMVINGLRESNEAQEEFNKALTEIIAGRNTA